MAFVQLPAFDAIVAAKMNTESRAAIASAYASRYHNDLEVLGEPDNVVIASEIGKVAQDDVIFDVANMAVDASTSINGVFNGVKLRYDDGECYARICTCELTESAGSEMVTKFVWIDTGKGGKRKFEVEVPRGTVL